MRVIELCREMMDLPPWGATQPCLQAQLSNTTRDIIKHDIYIYIYLAGDPVENSHIKSIKELDQKSSRISIAKGKERLIELR